MFARCSLLCFYIKPQPTLADVLNATGCSLLCFYIKPQLLTCMNSSKSVVPYHVSTSNHNYPATLTTVCLVVPYHVSTSNHNQRYRSTMWRIVVPYHVSTSNHNFDTVNNSWFAVVPYHVSTSNHNYVHIFSLPYTLFLIMFLHQTTTACRGAQDIKGCSLSCFYIKPQRKSANNSDG